MSYLLIKHAHLGFVLLSLGLFVFRLALSVGESAFLQRRWLRILPHVNDTLLLLCGLWLASQIGQYPFVNSPWLTAKLSALLLYIALGTLAIKRAPSPLLRLLCGLLALLVFGYMVAVAITKSPLAGLNI